MQNHFFTTGILSKTKLLSFLSAFILFSTSRCSSQSKGNMTLEEIKRNTFSVEQLKKDFAIMRSSLEEGSPSLYRYKSKEEISRLFDSVNKSFTHPQTIFRFHKTISQLLAGICDGHTKTFLPPAIMGNIYYAQKTLLPLELRFFGKEALVYRNYTSENIQEGARIISINAVPMPELIERLMKRISSDACNTAYKSKKLDGEFKYMLITEFEAANSFEVVFADKENKSTTVKLKAISFNETRKALAEKYESSQSASENYTVRYDDLLSVAFLDINSFAKEKGNKYENFLDETFRTIKEKNIQKLVIDVRDNGGGRDENAALLLSYTAKGPFKFYERRLMNHKRFSFLKYTDDKKLNLMLKFYHKEKTEDGYLLSLKWDKRINKPAPYAFTGKIFILVNGNTFSSAAAFVNNADHFTDAVFVGEECGGAYPGDSGVVVTVTLPETGLQVNVPIVRFDLPVSKIKFENVLVPEHTVSNNFDDILTKKDRQMDSTMSLIKKK